ncbi:hypothetical protein WMY93_006204 [Mugilogobius chulae]|uniref:SAP domain-containing protein n=1 Tax=Mugilogobius chulae TaxID=88201 RepID=A0AAW0PT52_9GOBI
MQPVKLPHDQFGCTACPKVGHFAALAVHVLTHEKSALHHNDMPLNITDVNTPPCPDSSPHRSRTGPLARHAFEYYGHQDTVDITKSSSTTNYITHRCTWGGEHRVLCELEKCKTALEFSQRSGAMGFQCMHLRSVSYCPSSQEDNTNLSDDILNDMVANKWISDATKMTCLQRRAAAESVNSPLSKIVELDKEESSEMHVSVLETNISYYARKICTTDQDLTNTLPTGSESVLLWNHNQYPPEGKTLTSLVKYLLSSKRIPAELTEDITSVKKEFPTHLIPFETACHYCSVPLSDPIVITRKAQIVCVSSTIEINDLQDPPPDFDGRVDIETFWHSVSEEIVCQGFVKSNRTNPCCVPPSFVKWAPWISPRTRGSNSVWNTEFSKTRSTKYPENNADIEVSEERLSDELVKVKVEDLRDLVKSCGLNNNGSKIDLLLRLRKEMKTRSTYDKVFEKVWGASGGLAVILCPCGIVNAVKFNLRAESPRDYADMLLSFKHFPNITVYDFARGLAAHTNLRAPVDIPFRPNEGGLHRLHLRT